MARLTLDSFFYYSNSLSLFYTFYNLLVIEFTAKFIEIVSFSFNSSCSSNKSIIEFI